MASKAAVLSAWSSLAACCKLGISACEDQLRSFSAGTSGRFEPNAGATADHDDSLPEKLGFSLDGRGGACVDHDYSD